jgi:hypothetical protein
LEQLPGIVTPVGFKNINHLKTKKMKTTFICSQCGQTITHNDNFTTGYATDKNNNKVCFICCGQNDKEALFNLKPKERYILYFDGKKITNWPGTLEIIPIQITKGKHNICKTRTDVYFKYNGLLFHGLNLGDNQILRINLIK